MALEESYVTALSQPNNTTGLENEKLPWVEKYRPKEINHVISHGEIIRSLKHFIAMKTLPHLLFFGPSGSGKTSTIMCCAKEIYGSYMEWMIMRLNASNERGIDTVRIKIKNFVSNRSSIFVPAHERSNFKLVILDEIDSMTGEAQGMLRQTIEKNSTTTRFCLICNDIDKIDIALQSRCTLYRFSPLTPKDMCARLEDICTIEKIQCYRKAIGAIVRISKGDMRTAINVLQHVSSTVGGKITTTAVYKILGYCTPKVLEQIFQLMQEVSNANVSLTTAITSVLDIMTEHNITVLNLLDELKNSVLAADYTVKQKIFLIDNFSKNEIYDSVNVDHQNIVMILVSLFVLVRNIDAT